MNWTASSETTGSLRVTVASPTGASDVETDPVLVTIDLSPGAHLSGDHDERCIAAGDRQILCTMAAPVPGDSTSAVVGVVLDGPPGQSATVSARQGGTSLGTHTVELSGAAGSPAAGATNTET